MEAAILVPPIFVADILVEEAAAAILVASIFVASVFYRLHRRFETFLELDSFQLEIDIIVPSSLYYFFYL